MEKPQLLAALRACQLMDADAEAAHIVADEALLAYIDDSEVTKAFEAIKKWYA